MPLNAKQKAFCQNYIQCLNATTAYLQVYDCKDETARRSASDFLTNPDIQNYIAQLQAESSLRTEVSQDKIIKELAHLAFSDLTNLVEFEEGRVTIKSSKKLTRDVTSSIKKFTVTRRFNKQENTETVETTIEVHDKIRSLDKLMQYLGMTSDFNLMMAIARRYGWNLFLDENGTLQAVRLEDSIDLPESTNNSAMPRTNN